MMIHLGRLFDEGEDEQGQAGRHGKLADQSCLQPG
jgi:hypothetical protein